MENDKLMLEAKDTLVMLIDSLNVLNLDEYTEKIALLGNTSIGEHTRHIIELFQQLMIGYDSGIIDYDNRKRNNEVETNIDVAINSIAEIISKLEKENKTVMINTVLNENASPIQSNYLRELMFNIEHCIHHQAIIKIAFRVLNKLDLSDNYGMAKSTTLYKNKCAQ